MNSSPEYGGSDSMIIVRAMGGTIATPAKTIAINFFSETREITTKAVKRPTAMTSPHITVYGTPLNSAYDARTGDMTTIFLQRLV